MTPAFVTADYAADTAERARSAAPARPAARLRLPGPGRLRARAPRPRGTGRTGAFATAAALRRYALLIAGLTVLAVVFALGVLLWQIPVDYGTTGYWRIVERRASSLAVIAVVAVGQGMATVAFQSVAGNRIVTPSLMGFEALYVAISTAAVFFLGTGGVAAVTGLPQFALMIGLMVAFSLALYGWLLSGKRASMQVMLLVGIVIGGGLASVATFMQRMLTPSEFDVLTARMFGSISNAEVSYLPLAIPLALVGAGWLWARARRLDVVALGPDTATNLGVDHRRETILTLLAVSVLMAVSTALIGPMTFLGFLVATLAYQFAGTHSHRRVFPVAALTGFVVLSGAYFALKHVLDTQGAVSIIIEAVGGIVFLVVILRKGRL